MAVGDRTLHHMRRQACPFSSENSSLALKLSSVLHPGQWLAFVLGVFFASVCVVCMCLCVPMCGVCAQMPIWRPEADTWMSSFTAHHLTYKAESHLNSELTDSTGLASQLAQVSSVPTSRALELLESHQAHWALIYVQAGVQTPVFVPVQQVLCPFSHLPSPI